MRHGRAYPCGRMLCADPQDHTSNGHDDGVSPGGFPMVSFPVVCAGVLRVTPGGLEEGEDEERSRCCHRPDRTWKFVTLGGGREFGGAEGDGVRNPSRPRVLIMWGGSGCWFLDMSQRPKTPSLSDCALKGTDKEVASACGSGAPTIN